MSSKFDTRLAELGITLPDTPAPVANYVSFVASGNIVYVSGQVSRDAERADPRQARGRDRRRRRRRRGAHLRARPHRPAPGWPATATSTGFAGW